MQASLSRRGFIRASATLTGAGLLGFPAIGAAQGANNKLNLAIVGCGGRGAGNLAEVSSENIVALCDVNERNLDAAARKHPKAKKYVDFRKLYEHAGDFDAVVALYHDQGLAPLKTLEFDQAVNITLGLPWVRTSPDHGTGFDIAGRGLASAASFANAVRMARMLVEHRARLRRAG